MQRLYHQTVVYAWTVHQSYCMRVPPNPSRCRAISHHRINVCTSVGIATVETLHATSLPPNRRVCMDGASIVLHARPAKPRAVLCHLPPPDFYLCVCWHRTRRDVACNVSTPPDHRICMVGSSIVLRSRPAKPNAASCHLPPPDFYLCVCWCRTRRDVACNVSTPPNRRGCVDGTSNVLLSRPAKSRAMSCHFPPPDQCLYVGWYRNRRDVACNVSTSPDRCMCLDGASIVLHARPAKPIAVSCHFPPTNRYLCICWYRNRRDVACNVSTTKPSWVRRRYIKRIAFAPRQIPCDVVPFPTAGFLFVRLLVSHP
jgi:hypothetical protein